MLWIRPCLAGEPTPDPKIARRSQRIASLAVEGEATGFNGRERRGVWVCVCVKKKDGKDRRSGSL